MGYSDILPKYVSATGGGQVFSELSRNAIEEAYAQITSEARNQYTLGYSAPKAGPAYRDIEVKVERPGLKIYAKYGYYPVASWAIGMTISLSSNNLIPQFSLANGLFDQPSKIGNQQCLTPRGHLSNLHRHDRYDIKSSSPQRDNFACGRQGNGVLAYSEEVLSFINFAAREINCKIVYYGAGLGGKTTNLQVIYQKNRGAAEGQDDLPRHRDRAHAVL